MTSFMTIHYPVAPFSEAPRPSAVAHPIAIQRSTNVAMINPAIIHLQNPQFSGFGGGVQGLPRQIFTLPVVISPTASPTDQTLFEEPQDGTKKHYLPRYGIAATASGGAAAPAAPTQRRPIAPIPPPRLRHGPENRNSLSGTRRIGNAGRNARGQ